MTIFRSRKFVSAVSVALLTGLNDGLGLGLEPSTIHWIAGVVIAWIVGESAVDAAHALGGQAAEAKGKK